jgi:Flp pilus assembly pilin Flp
MKAWVSGKQQARGGETIEYALVLAIIVGVVVIGFPPLSTKLSCAMSSIACAIVKAGGGSCAVCQGGSLKPFNQCSTGCTNGISKFSSPLNSQDVNFSATATLTGNGFGVWLRATPPTSGTGNASSGYTFQVDPGAGNKFLVKVWLADGTASDVTLKGSDVGFPAGFDTTAAHDLSLNLVGNNLSVTVDGTKIYGDAGLNLADAANKTTGVAGKTLPAGDQSGVRTWYGTGVTMQNAVVGSGQSCPCG